MEISGAWTYDGNPTWSTTSTARQRDWVRFRVGDTDGRDKLISDEEISAMVAETGNRWLAAAECAEHIAARLAREADISTAGDGGQNRALSQRARAYEALAQRLRRRASFQATPYAGGISVDDKDDQVDDDDRPVDPFIADQWDNTITS